MADNNCGCGDISINNPFNLEEVISDNCICTNGGLVLESKEDEVLPENQKGCCVISVNGKDGVVLLNTDDIPEGNINLYFTVQRARESISAVLPIEYDTPNGVISHAVSGIVAGTYGDATHFPIITVDQWGHITNIDVQEIANNALDPDLQAIADLDGTGYLVKTAPNTWVFRSIFGSNGRIVLTNQDAVANPTIIDLAIIPGLVPGIYGNALLVPKITVDQYGRIVAIEEVAIPFNNEVPPHTHTLGELSNVDDLVDTNAVVGQVLGWDGVQWTMVNQSGVLANNGLHLDGGFVKLGGPLIESTAVTTGDFKLLFESVNNGALVTTDVLLEDSPNDNKFIVTAIKLNTRQTIADQSWKSIQWTVIDDIQGTASILLDHFGIRMGTQVDPYFQVNTFAQPQEIWFPTYPSVRDDGVVPTNFLHTGNNGELFSSPIAAIIGPNNAWLLLGNAGTNPLINFLGTTDNAQLRFRVNNIFSGEIDHINANTLFGYLAGAIIGGGTGNSAFGYNAMAGTGVGIDNSAFGSNALITNSEGSGNVAVGVSSLGNSQDGNNNTAVGYFALSSNIHGGGNTAVGHLALLSNADGLSNTGLGKSADVGDPQLENATAIGANAYVEADNSMVLGSINGTNGATADTFIGIGITIPTEKLHVHAGNPRFTTGNEGLNKIWTSDANGVGEWQDVGAIIPDAWALLGNAGTIDGTNFLGTTDNVPMNFRVNNLPAGRIDIDTANTFLGSRAGFAGNLTSENTAIGFEALFTAALGTDNTAVGVNALFTLNNAGQNTAVGSNAMQSKTTGNSNTAIGFLSGFLVTTGTENTYVGYQSSSAIGMSNATAIGAKAFAGANDTLILGSINGINGALTDTQVGIGITLPEEKLHIHNGNILISNDLFGILIRNTANDAGIIIKTDAAGLPYIYMNKDAAEDSIELRIDNLTEVRVFQMPDSVLNNLTIPISVNGVVANAQGEIVIPIDEGNDWKLLGNAGTIDGTNFIGTTDDVAFNIRINNQKAGRIDRPNGVVLLGYQAGNVNVGTSNTGIGHQALLNNAAGNTNTAIGAISMATNTTGIANTALGYQSLSNNSTGNNNTAIGLEALFSNTVNDNTAVGYQAMRSNTTGLRNTAVGKSALFANLTAIECTAIGYQALLVTTATRGTAVGASALTANTTGSGNTAFGALALTANMTGEANIGIGVLALGGNITGNYNVAVGSAALMIAEASGNIAIGRETMIATTSGGFNTAVGYSALDTNTTGSSNTCIGSSTLQNNTTGSENTAIGGISLGTNTTGSANTALGYQADVGVNNLTNATAIGYKAYVGASDCMVLGSINGVNTALTDTKVGIGITIPTERLHVVGQFRLVNGTEGLGKVLVSDANGVSSWGDGAGQWIKITKTFADFSAAATNNDIEIYSLPARAMIQSAIIKHTASFTGGAIATYTLSLGLVADFTRYIDPFDVFQAAGNTVFGYSPSFKEKTPENFGAATSIRMQAVSTGANLNAAGAGSVDIYLLITTLP